MSELKIIDLGCMNGWGPNKPAEYLSHIANCGETVYDSKGREQRNYTGMTCRTLARNYEEVRCCQCGIKFTVDSSD